MGGCLSWVGLLCANPIRCALIAHGILSSIHFGGVVVCWLVLTLRVLNYLTELFI